MVFKVEIDAARALFPEYEFVKSLTPSAQKSAFHVRCDGVDLCLKIISPDQGMDRVHREVIAMQTIQHPNVVRLVDYEFSVKDGNIRHYIVEEYIPGTDFSEHFQVGKSWPIENIKKMFVPLADGLVALETAKIVHRDLKPSNIRVKDGVEPIIIDFGLARLLEMQSLTRTFQGAQIGTPAYFAPEQYSGTKYDIDNRTDLYALGVMMFEAALGKHPTLSGQEQDIEEMSEAVCAKDVNFDEPEFPNLPKALQLLIKRLLERERSKRPHSAQAVAKILRAMEAN